MKISKARFFVNKFDNDVIKWVKEDFGMDRSENNNTMEAFDSYVSFAVNTKVENLSKLYE